MRYCTNHSGGVCRPLGKLASLLLCLIGSTAAAQDLPSLGDGASRIVSPQMERRIGEAFLRQLHANLPITEDVLVQYYVEQHM